MIRKGFFVMIRSSLPWLATVALLPAALAQQPGSIEYFERYIRPLLAEKCYACHSADTVTMGELGLDSKEAVLRGGSRGARGRTGRSSGQPAGEGGLVCHGLT